MEWSEGGGKWDNCNSIINILKNTDAESKKKEATNRCFSFTSMFLSLPSPLSKNK